MTEPVTDTSSNGHGFDHRTALFPRALLAVMFAIGLLTATNAQAELVSKYDANVGVETDENNDILLWEDQVATSLYDLEPNNFPSLAEGVTPIGGNAVLFEAFEDDALAGPPAGHPLAAATQLTAAVVFSALNDDADNAPDNANFWGHPQLASGDQGGGHPDWGFSWGSNSAGDYNIWFGVGEDTGSGTPTVTATGAQPDPAAETWYIGVGTWDGDLGEIGVYLYDQDANLIDSETMDTPFASVERVDVGFSTGGERPNLNARNLDGYVAAIELYDNPVDANGANNIASAMSSTYLTGGGGGVPLQAGDANQDLQFNQLDIVQVQIAARYLSGQPATWGEGDWDGAPGGSPGNPPQGNRLFDQLDIVAALSAGKYLTGPYGAVAGGGVTADEQTSIVYNPSTGELRVDAPAGSELTSVNIDSAAGIFTGAAAQNLGGSFDNDTDSNIFKATFGGSFGSLSFGNVAPIELSRDFLLNDLTVVGSLAGGGDLGDVDLVYVPEPSTFALLLASLAGMITVGRRRSLARRPAGR
jgi:hypothetical protein